MKCISWNVNGLRACVGKNFLEDFRALGADFFCILATTGETPTLTAEEKKKIKELVINTVGGKVPILVGCGGNNTTAVVEELQNGDFKGIDGVLSVCPYYNKPSQEGLYQHFKACYSVTRSTI